MPRLSAVLMMGLAATVVACSPDSETRPVKDDGAGSEPFVVSTTVTLSCTGGVGVNIAYAEDGRAQLTLGQKTYALTLQEAGQGVLYAGDGVQWSSQNRNGEEISTLNRLDANGRPIGGPLAQCRRPAAQLVTAPEKSDLKPCISPDLSYAVETGDAGMGHRLTTIGLQNRGPQACQMKGYPRVSLEGEGAEALAQVRISPQTGGYFGTVSEALPIILRPKERAYFDLSWSVVPNEAGGEVTCPQTGGIKIAPPGDSGGKSLGLAITICGGKLGLSPLRATVARQNSVKISTPSAQ